MKKNNLAYTGKNFIANIKNLTISGLNGPAYYDEYSAMTPTITLSNIVDGKIKQRSVLSIDSTGSRLTGSQNDYIWSSSTIKTIPYDRSLGYVYGDILKYNFNSTIIILSYVISVVCSWVTYIINVHIHNHIHYIIYIHI